MGGGQSKCTFEGKLHNGLQEHLPTDTWKYLTRPEGVSLENIYYCQNINNNHHFLIIELVKDDKYYNIRAEKFGHPTPGTYLQWVNDTTDVAARNESKVTTLRCGGKRVQLPWLVNILERLSPLYNYVCENCWDFAQDAAKTLVKNLPDSSSSEKQDLLHQIPF
ncbi:hypothetical protein L7F22_038077 [Adiantum nelumboides]|nr:hypothetical protein [Adiantum nelumboides]